MSQMRNGRLSRRGFLGRTALAAGGAMAAPYVITSNALGAPGTPAASDRIVTGVIGYGGRARSDMSAFMSNSDCGSPEALILPRATLDQLKPSLSISSTLTS